MRRRAFLRFAGAAAAWPLAGRAATSDRIPRIGYLVTGPRDVVVDEFFLGLRDLGWIDGDNLRVEIRVADGDRARMSAFAEEFVRTKVDLIVTYGYGVFVARRATADIPIVFVTAGDLVALGLADSLAHPGGNITGQAFFQHELMVKRLDLLKRVLSSVTRVGVLLDRSMPTNSKTMSEMDTLARTLQVSLQPIAVASLEEIEPALAGAMRTPLDACLVTDPSLFVPNSALIAAIAQRLGLPCFGASEFAEAGGLVGYGVDFRAMFHSVAVYVDKILRGANPGDIPIEQPTKFKTVVNLKTAAAFKIEIPPTLLAAADEVIE
jgi:putative tryptophan/tyrosine transport system substrate-binding protein